MLGDIELPVRANLGLYTQPISFIGLPVVAVPVPLVPLPIGVQIIAAPWREDVALRLAHALEAQGRRRRDAAGDVAKTFWEDAMEIDLPEVVAEVTAAFERYEKALGVERCRYARRAVSRRSPHHPLRRRSKIFTAIAEIMAFRAARSPAGLARTLSKTVITTYGRDFAVASTLFRPRRLSRAKSAARCRPGCALPKAGASSPPHVSMIDA